MKNWLTELRISLVAVLSLAVILCGLYPAAVWVLAQGLFPAKANGSLIERSGTTLGSSLIGQSFSGPEYFHPRPSAAGQGYDAARSGGSNLGPTSKKLVDAVRRRASDYRAENSLGPEIMVPADAVTASASGLDPHISLKNALLQMPRVARTRGLREMAVRKLVEAYTGGRDLGILGEPGVNVLMLNLALNGTLK
ncbi:MAG: K(+)-transporting ATPase subunit C [Candidatus Aminicenantes bacterium]|nr:K(+)-transporting ATPase subunit C [Candidatus Aminicenantes bacterium]